MDDHSIERELKGAQGHQRQHTGDVWSQIDQGAGRAETNDGRRFYRDGHGNWHREYDFDTGTAERGVEPPPIYSAREPSSPGRSRRGDSLFTQLGCLPLLVLFAVLALGRKPSPPYTSVERLPSPTGEVELVSFLRTTPRELMPKRTFAVVLPGKEVKPNNDPWAFPLALEENAGFSVRWTGPKEVTVFTNGAKPGNYHAPMEVVIKVQAHR